jgi:hypothetical protein
MCASWKQPACAARKPPYRTSKRLHGFLLLENISNEAISFVLNEVIPVCGHHARRILASVLQH